MLTALLSQRVHVYTYAHIFLYPERARPNLTRDCYVESSRLFLSLEQC